MNTLLVYIYFFRNLKGHETLGVHKMTLMGLE